MQNGSLASHQHPISVSQILVHCRHLGKEAGEQDKAKRGQERQAILWTRFLQGVCLARLLLPSELVWDTRCPTRKANNSSCELTLLLKLPHSLCCSQ